MDATGKNMLAIAKVDVPTMRKWKTNLGELPSKLKNITPKTAFSFFGKVLVQKNVHFLYEVDLKNEEAFSTAPTILNQQKYVDLLNYQDNKPFLTRRKILIDALEKFAKGDVLFSQSNKSSFIALALSNLSAQLIILLSLFALFFRKFIVCSFLSFQLSSGSSFLAALASCNRSSPYFLICLGYISARFLKSSLFVMPWLAIAIRDFS